MTPDEMNPATVARDEEGFACEMRCETCGITARRGSDERPGMYPWRVPDWVWDAGFRWHDDKTGFGWVHKCAQE